MSTVIGTGILGRPSGRLGIGILGRAVEATYPGRPDLTVEIAFTTDPTTNTPVWEDVTSYVRDLSWRRGRRFELDRFETGSAVVVLSNQDRTFEPEYSGSPFSPNILPARLLRVTASHHGETLQLFRGAIGAWPETQGSGLDAMVTLTVKDGFDALARPNLNATFPAQTTSERVTAVLDAIGWPSTARSIGAGISDLAPITITDTKALAHLQAVDATENGRLFVDGAGRVVFQGRHALQVAPWSLPQVTFGDGGGNELPYIDIVPEFTPENIYNDIRVTFLDTAGTAVGGTVAWTDATSQATYYVRTHKRDLLTSSDGEADAAGSYLLGRYKDPVRRFSQVTIDPRMDTRLWAQVVTREIGDRATVNRRPLGGAVVSKNVVIEYLEHTIDYPSRNWLVTYRLSPADAADWLIIGSATRGRIGTDQTGY